MARTSIKKPAVKPAEAKSADNNPFKLRLSGGAYEAEPLVHVMGHGIRCDTESRGRSTPNGRSITEIVVDASEGFIPLWAKNTTLRWRFRESTLKSFENPESARVAIEQLLAEAILRWGDAAPVKFTKAREAWDFEIVVKHAEDCDSSGCVLASAAFPGGGQQKLFIYPTMFSQEKEEQIETLIHEIGHVFGLRHFFAKISETDSASQLFGAQSKFTIMNYGPDSKLTDADKADLKRLYNLAWSGQLTQINGTSIKFVQPFHALGAPVA